MIALNLDKENSLMYREHVLSVENSISILGLLITIVVES